MQQDPVLKNPTFKKNYCTLAELAQCLNVPQDTIAHYAEMGILPYVQLGEPLIRYYHKKRTRERLLEIKRFGKQGKTVEELQRIYEKDVKRHQEDEGLKAWD